MNPKTKLILKISAGITAGLLLAAYLPLILPALAPNTMGTIHIFLTSTLGLSPLASLALPGALIGGTVALVSTVKSIKTYLAQKKLEKQIKQIIARREQQKLALQKQRHRPHKLRWQNWFQKPQDEKKHQQDGNKHPQARMTNSPRRRPKTRSDYVDAA